MRHLVTYDISSDRHRQRIADLLHGALHRVQFSVFEGEPPATLLDQTVERCLPHLTATRDSLRVYRLCAACANGIRVYGHSPKSDPASIEVL